MKTSSIIAHLYVKKYAFDFTAYSGNTYHKSVANLVDSVLKDGSPMTLGSDKDSLSAGQYFFDDTTLILYIYDSSLSDSEYMITYKLLFSTSPLKYSHDLTSDGVIYEYSPRLKVSSAFNIKVDGSAVGTALIGAGSIKLENTDGYFNSWRGFYWENQKAKLFSIEDGVVKLIYEGVISGKDFDPNSLNIKISNDLTIINKSIESETISESTPGAVLLNDSVYGIYRNRIWGKVDGVKAQSISVNPETYTLSGDVTSTSGSSSITGSGTSFLSEVSSGDTLYIGDNEYDVIEVISDTSLTISEDSTTTFTGEIDIEYSVLNPTFNRVWDISARALRETQINIIGQSASTIFELEGGRSDLVIGDHILYYSDSTGEFYSRTIESLYANNILLNQAISPSFGIGDYVVRKPIQMCYHNFREVTVHPDIISVENSANGCRIELARDFEYYSGKKSYIDASGTWTGTIGDNYIQRDAISESILDALEPRNYFITGGKAYEIASVTTNDTYTRIRFTTNLTSTVSQDGLWIVFVQTLDFQSILSCDVIGETDDGLTSGSWIRTGIQFIKQQLNEEGLSDKLSVNLDVVDSKNSQRISLIAPISPGKKAMPKLKTLVDTLNQSLGGCLFVNNSFEFDYKILDFSFDYSTPPTFIEEYDLINWSSKIERNQLYAKVNYGYNKKQIDYITQESGESIYSNSGKLANLLSLTNTLDFSTCFYDLIDARCSANRKLFLSSLLNTTISIQTDSRFNNLNLLDIVEISLNNFPEIADNLKSRFMLVLEIKKNIDKTSLVLGDVGASLNRRSLITPDSFVDYDSAVTTEVIKSSYITDENGLVDGEETKDFNLII